MEEKKQVSWNLSEAIIFELAGLLQLASTHYLTGNINKWFFTLKAVKMRILPKLSKEERDSLKKIELKFGKSYQQKYEKNSKIRGICISSVEEYNEAILDYLKDYGFYPRDMEDSTKIN